MSIGGLSKRNPAVYLLRKLEIFGYKNADIIVGTMPKLDVHIRAVINSNFSFKWLPTGIDVEKTKELQLPTEIAQNIPKDKFIAAYAGSLGRVNCVEEIIDAAEFLSDRMNIHFIILGNGPLESSLKRRASKLDNVTFVDKIDKKYVNGFLMRCSVLLHPVMDREIYNYGISPNKWIDYMLSGRPIIVSYNGFPSLISDAKCGVFIKAQNPILLAKEIVKFSEYDESVLAEMGCLGKNYVLEKLNYNRLSDEYLALL
jgi:glycosyltransferase involved in cell wall biosynthesis